MSEWKLVSSARVDLRAAFRTHRFPRESVNESWLIWLQSRVVGEQEVEDAVAGKALDVGEARLVDGHAGQRCWSSVL